MVTAVNQVRKTTCAICRQVIEGQPSILQPGTTVWLSARSGEGHGHLHQPKETPNA